MSNQKSWILNPLDSFINNGPIVEAFVGQELLTISEDYMKDNLHYWIREQKGSNAEVDYLVEIGSSVVPIEVKSGLSGKEKSIKIFLQEKKSSPYGILFSKNRYSAEGKIRHLPLYGVCATRLI
ncbi:MAG: DUF4143 domain-containing protein [Oligoflexia bacterium]|nr:DUF4143 domain-containing protein [Oligoflexia bacterium]MBF0366335.1 DUF4143 domain-containing protein [Oligoflexia bacterium]